MGRQYCYRCFKPQVVCICDRVVPVDNQTEILILQHKCERDHHVGTVRIALLGLKNVEVRVIWPDGDGKFRDDNSVGSGAGLLYPGPDAVDLESLDDAQKPQTLVVLDGSWADARSLYRDNPWIQQLPHYKLDPKAPSNYRIRKEPHQKAISSIEAIVQALKILEPECERVESLVEAFDSMIDDQIKYLEDPARKASPRRFQRPRKRGPRAIPKLLKKNEHKLVVAYGESVSRADHSRELVSWTALRLDDGALFEQFIAPSTNAFFDDHHLEFMELPSAVFETSVTKEGFIKQWTEFFGPEDVLLTWNCAVLDLFENLTQTRPPGLFVKDTYCNLRGGKCGHLQDVVHKENLTCHPVSLKGRSAARISELAAVVQMIKQQ